jgi:hypothetical protein
LSIHFPMDLVLLPQPTSTVMVVGVDSSAEVGRQGLTAAQASVSWTGREVHLLTASHIFGAASHGETQGVADVLETVPPEVEDLWLVVDSEADVHSLSRLAHLPLHQALATGLGTQVHAIFRALVGRVSHLRIHLVKVESHRFSALNHVADASAGWAWSALVPVLYAADDPGHTHLQHVPPRRSPSSRGAGLMRTGRRKFRSRPTGGTPRPWRRWAGGWGASTWRGTWRVCRAIWGWRWRSPIP